MQKKWSDLPPWEYRLRATTEKEEGVRLESFSMIPSRVCRTTTADCIRLYWYRPKTITLLNSVRFWSRRIIDMLNCISLLQVVRDQTLFY